MKTLKSIILGALVVSLSAFSVYAQSDWQIDNLRNQDKSGLNVFEPAKVSDLTFDGLYVRVGGANTLQFQV